jgi:hypothetical protein
MTSVNQLTMMLRVRCEVGKVSNGNGTFKASTIPDKERTNSPM